MPYLVSVKECDNPTKACVKWRISHIHILFTMSSVDLRLLIRETKILVNNLPSNRRNAECTTHCLRNVALDKRISIPNDVGTTLHFSTAFSRVLSGTSVVNTSAVKFRLVPCHNSSWRNSINKFLMKSQWTRISASCNDIWDQLSPSYCVTFNIRGTWMSNQD